MTTTKGRGESRCDLESFIVDGIIIADIHFYNIYQSEEISYRALARKIHYGPSQIHGAIAMLHQQKEATRY
jgi:hypothetical protein